MAVTLRVLGTGTANPTATTAINPDVGSGATASDLSVLAVAMKPYTTTITTPSGWTKIGEWTNGTVASGADTGSMKLALYYQIGAAVGAIGNITFSGADTAAAGIVTYQNGTGAWDVANVINANDTTDGTSWSATAASGLDLQFASDIVFTAMAMNSDTGTITSPTFVGMSGMTQQTQSGAFNAVNSQGNDCRLYCRYVNFSAGSSTAAPGFTLTTSSNTSGTQAFLRVRESLAKTATLTGTGSVTSTGQVDTAATSTVTGTGSTTASGATGTAASATVSGTGSISTAGLVAMAAASTLTGVGTITAAGVAASSTTATLTGAGSVTVTGAAGKSTAASLVGSGTISSAGVVDLPSTATVSGTGTVTADGATGTSRTASVAGVGTITAAGTVTAGVSASSTVAGTGAVTVDGFVGRASSVTISGTGAVTSAGQAGRLGDATVTGVGAIDADGTVATSAGTSLTITGAIDTAGTVGLTGDALDLAGIGIITVTGAVGDAYTVPRNPQVTITNTERGATFVGTGAGASITPNLAGAEFH